MRYVDGYVLPMPKKSVKAYLRMAREGEKLWRKHGALDYKECVGDDLVIEGKPLFPNLVKPRRGESIVFSWIVFKSRSHRDKVNAKVIADPRLADMMKPGAMPFDMKRMVYGGFKVIVSA